jgi:hypothetical protein
MTFSADIITSATFSTSALKLTTGATSGYVLTSDASGNATWTASSGSNFANTDLTFTGNRVHNTNGNSFQLTSDGGNFVEFFIYGDTASTSYGYGAQYIYQTNTSTEIYSNQANRIKMITSETVVNENGFNIDFRVEGDNDSNLLFVDASSDSIGMGTASPNYKLQVLGTVSTTGFRMTNGAQSGYVLTSDASGVATWQASSGGVSGTGTTNYVTKWNSSTGLTNSIIYDSGTAIGIGTASPSELLHVDGNLRIGGQVYTDVPSVLVPTGTTQTINWNDGNYQILDLGTASGNVTLTLSNPKVGAVYSIQVIQGAVTRSLVYPATIKWEGGASLVPTGSNDAIDLITMIYNGTDYLASYGAAYA